MASWGTHAEMSCYGSLWGSDLWHTEDRLRLFNTKYVGRTHLCFFSPMHVFKPIHSVLMETDS